MRKKLLTGEALRARAETLGVVIFVDDRSEPQGDYAMFRAVVSEAELQRRVLEAEQHILANRAWLLALISAIASVISASAAWVAILIKGYP